MQTKLFKSVFVISLLVICIVSSNCSCIRYGIPSGSTWQSSNPDMWFTGNADGTKRGELRYNDEVIEIEVDSRDGWVGLSIVEFWVQGVDNFNEGCLIRTSVSSSSKTKLVLNVRYCTLQGFDEEQIVFIRSD